MRGEVLVGDALEVGALDGEVAIEFGVDEIGIAVEEVIAGEIFGAGAHGAEATGEGGFLLVAGFLEFLFGDALFFDAFDFFIDQGIEAIEGDALLASGVDAEHAGFFEEEREDLDAEGGLFFFDEAFVEAGAAAGAEDIAEEFEGVAIGVSFWASWPSVEGGWERGIGLEDIAGDGGGLGGDVDRRADDGWASGDGAEVIGDEFFGGFEVEIASDGEGGVIGDVESFVEVAELFDGGFVDVLGGADGDPGVGGIFEDEFG